MNATADGGAGDLPPTLDAHAHLRPGTPPEVLAAAGPALAMTLDLAEARKWERRATGPVVAAVGCHPRRVEGQAAFDRVELERLLASTPVVGEVGLDGGSRVAADVQRRTFRAILEAVARTPRLVSIHSSGATRAVLEELGRRPIAAPILHGWRGSAAETREAVALGCSFSIGAQVARRATWKAVVPPGRLLLETDQGWGDPPSAIALKLAWVEALVAARAGIAPAALRALQWRNLATLIRATGTIALWPAAIADRLPGT